MSEELNDIEQLAEELERYADDPREVESKDRQMCSAAAAKLRSLKTALHDVDGYCNTVRGNYRSGSQEEIIASTIKLKIREFLRA